MNRTCPFCHEAVSAKAYAEHMARHSEIGPDGQMEDHMTLPPSTRDKGSLSGVPSVYQHTACGQETEMPEEIIRTYLVDPKFYNGYTFCAHCGIYPHQSEFTWVDTGENLHSYNRRLFREKGLGYKLLYVLTSAVGVGLLGAGVGLALSLGLGWPIEVTVILSTLAGGVLGQKFGRRLRLALLSNQ